MRPADPAGQPVEFVERLAPSAGARAAVVFFAALFGLIPLRYTGPVPAVLTGLVCVAAAVAALERSCPVIAVAGGRLHAGRAVVPLVFVASVTPLTTAEMTRLLGPNLDARAYLCQRGWITTGVKVTLNDRRDPTPYWLLSTRRPRELTDAIRHAVTDGAGAQPAEGGATGPFQS